jgi:hypothetical protein
MTTLELCAKSACIEISCIEFSSFCVQEVFLCWICLVLRAIEFFEKSIECLYSFFSEFREEYDGDFGSM